MASKWVRLGLSVTERGCVEDQPQKATKIKAFVLISNEPA
jgi:hypothetical protein